MKNVLGYAKDKNKELASIKVMEKPAQYVGGAMLRDTERAYILNFADETSAFLTGDALYPEMTEAECVEFLMDKGFF